MRVGGGPGGGKQELSSTRLTRVNKYQEYFPKHAESALSFHLLSNYSHINL
jgi:hypothetical protein